MILLIKYQEKILMSAVSACKPYDPQLVNMDLHLLLSYPVLDHALGQTEERRLTFVRGEILVKSQTLDKKKRIKKKTVLIAFEVLSSL